MAVITTATALGQSIEYIIHGGERLGEKIYNFNHPDSGLGKMEYTKKDFQHPNWYLPPTQHPNNMNGNSFHAGFGGF